MGSFLSLGMGYVIGCINPAAWISKKKNVDLTKEGTGNLGATNTAIVLGKAAGIFVMLFDIFKSFFCFKLAKYLFPQKMIAGILASIGTILGHCFPVTMHFRGGKGLAAFGGLILAYKAWMFPAIVIPGLLLMMIFNTGVAAPIFATVAFPVLVYRNGDSLEEVLAVAAACLIIFIMHWDNLKLAWNKKDVVNTKEFFKTVFKRK